MVATWLNHTTISCLIPPPPTNRTLPYNVTVEVSEDGRSFTENGVTFEFHGPPKPIPPLSPTPTPSPFPSPTNTDPTAETVLPWIIYVRSFVYD